MSENHSYHTVWTPGLHPGIHTASRKSSRNHKIVLTLSIFGSERTGNGVSVLAPILHFFMAFVGGRVGGVLGSKNGIRDLIQVRLNIALSCDY